MKKVLQVQLSILLVSDLVVVRGTFPVSDRYNYTPWATVGSWFLGPRGENTDTFIGFLEKIVLSHQDVRQNTYKWDKPYIDEKMSSCLNFNQEINQLGKELDIIIDDLSQSVPFHSLRYQGHMNWETTMPAQLGYFAAMMYNPNNVAAEASPITTGYEIEVGEHMCEMLGYRNTVTASEPKCWAHITSCGSVANIESGWAARNLKYFPIAVHTLVTDNYYNECKDYRIKIINDEEKLLIYLTHWELLNLDLDVVSDMYDNIKNHIIKKKDLSFQESEAFGKALDEELEELTLATLGMLQFQIKHVVESSLMDSKSLVPATMHYSWPKMTTVLGLGKASVTPLILDEEARIDLKNLREILKEHLKNKQPIMMVVGVVGTTEESSVDPIAKIAELREEFREKGLNFWFHADGAWGGYYRTMINIQKPKALPDIVNIADQYVPAFPVNDYTLKQLKALPKCDSITLDPHKSGYVQYPAGALAYRNIAYRNFVTVSAPVVFHGGVDPTVGIYGLEGSKPGAAPTAVLLSHRVIGLDDHGYGRILGQAMYGAKLFYSMWLTVANDDDPFECFPMKPLPDDCLPGGCSRQEAKDFVRTHIIGRSNAYIFWRQETLDFLHKVGPDTSINAFACNYKLRVGESARSPRSAKSAINTNIEDANKFNDCLFKHLSYSNLEKDVRRVSMMLTSSKKDPKTFGKAISKFKSTMGLGNIHGDEPVTFLINTVMNPLQTSEGHISSIARQFRETALVCYGQMTDHIGYHGFVVAGYIENDQKFFGDHLSVFKEHKHQYQAILRFQMTHSRHIELINKKLDEDKSKPIIIINKIHYKPDDDTEIDLDEGVLLHEIAFGKGRKSSINYDVYHGFDTVPFEPFLENIEIKTEDVLYFKHFDEFWKIDSIDVNLPKQNNSLQYYLYGTKHQSFMSKINHGHFPDVHHIIQLKHERTKPPFTVDDLNFGVEVKIVHPINRFKDRVDWIPPFYLPTVMKSKKSKYCNDKQTYEVDIGDNCLTSLLTSPDKEIPYKIEFPYPFGDTTNPDIFPSTVVVYGKSDVWYDTIEINKGLGDSGDECFLKDTSFLGYDLPVESNGHGIKTVSAKECEAACDAEIECGVWTFFIDWETNCYLKSKVGEESENEGAISGIKGECGSGGITVGEGECIFEDTNFQGGDLSTNDGGNGIVTENAEECNHECKDRPKCHYWTYVGKWETNCYLKSTLGDVLEYQGAVSGTYEDKCDIDKPEETEDTKCPDTHPFAYLNGYYCCELKQEKGISNFKDKLCDYGALSTESKCCYEDKYLECESPPCKDRVKDTCFDYGVDYYGNDLKRIRNVKPAQNCQKLCQNHSKCKFWTVWRNNCFLKSKKTDLTKNGHNISGPKYCK